VKHATALTLGQLARLLAALRKRPGMREKKPGIFYCGARAHLHFHEHEGLIYADLKVGSEFVRYRVSTAAEQTALLRQVDRSLS
jgi:hypothetical protein